jgi:hypothetical protein
MATTWDKKLMIASIKKLGSSGGSTDDMSVPKASASEVSVGRRGSGTRISVGGPSFPSRQQILQNVAQKHEENDKTPSMHEPDCAQPATQDNAELAQQNKVGASNSEKGPHSALREREVVAQRQHKEAEDRAERLEKERLEQARLEQERLEKTRAQREERLAREQHERDLHGVTSAEEKLRQAQITLQRTRERRASGQNVTEDTKRALLHAQREREQDALDRMQHKQVQQEPKADETVERHHERTRSRAESIGSVQDPNISNWEAVQDPDYPNQIGPFYFWNYETDEVVWDLPEGLEKPLRAGPLLYAASAPVPASSNRLPQPSTAQLQPSTAQPQPSTPQLKQGGGESTNWRPPLTQKPSWARQQGTTVPSVQHKPGGVSGTSHGAKALQPSSVLGNAVASSPPIQPAALKQPASTAMQQPTVFKQPASTAALQQSAALKQPTSQPKKMPNSKYSAFNHVLVWMQGVVEDDCVDVNNFDGSVLQSGVVLCELLNILQPDSVPKIHRVDRDSDGQFGAIAKFRISENATNFIKGCQKLGMPRNCAFDTQELTELRDVKAVLRCVETLGKMLGQL